MIKDTPAKDICAGDILVDLEGQTVTVDDVLDCGNEVVLFFNIGQCAFVSNDQLVRVEQ